MVKLSIRDLWGKRTEKKALKPEVRNMLMSLDGVYEPREPAASPHPDQRDEEDSRETTR